VPISSIKKFSKNKIQLANDAIIDILDMNNVHVRSLYVFGLIKFEVNEEQFRILVPNSSVTKIISILEKFYRTTANKEEFYAKFSKKHMSIKHAIDLFSKMQRSYINSKLYNAYLGEHKAALTYASKVTRTYGYDDYKKCIKHAKLILKPSYLEQCNKHYISKSKQIYSQFFKEVESSPLNEDQQDAVLTDEDITIVLAGAGSGKTSVISAKVAFILNNYLANPDEILVMAFNADAAMELKERISKIADHGSGVEIGTFHRIGNKYLRMDKKNTTLVDENKIKKKAILSQLLISRFKSDDLFFYKYLEAFYICNCHIEAHKHKTKKSYTEACRYADLVTYQSETVKSTEELSIANFLYINGVNYIYEKKYEHVDYNYTPDFYLPDYDIYIEHYGVDRSYRAPNWFSNPKKYADDIFRKRKVHLKHDTILVETYSYMFYEGNIFDELRSRLTALGVEFKNAIKYDSIDNLLALENKAYKLHQTFDIVCGTISQYMANNLSYEYLLDKANKHSSRVKLMPYLKVFPEIYNMYISYLSKRNMIDFDLMIMEGIENIKSFNTSHYKYIIVDECQDFSKGRLDIVKAFKDNSHENVKYFFVGDDWQSINRFAGSNMVLMQSKEDLAMLGCQKTVKLKMTYRYPQSVADVSSSFITKNARQIKKEILSPKISKGKSFHIRHLKKGVSEIDEILNCVENILAGKDSSIVSILILGRYAKYTLNGDQASGNNFWMKKFQEIGYQVETNHNDKFVCISKNGKKAKIRELTIHKSKGLGADHVIVRGLSGIIRGFPSKIESDPIIELFLPYVDDYPYSEERRLFYVAITRTKNDVYMVVDSKNPSIFSLEIQRDYKEYIDSNQELCSNCDIGYLSISPKGFKKCSACGLSLFRCSKCNTGCISPVYNDAKCSNKECDNVAKKCPSCNIGFLVPRESNKGDKISRFFGCSNYATEVRCRYTDTESVF